MHFNLARTLVFVLLSCSLSQALADAPSFDVSPQLQVGHTRLDLAEHWPSKYRAAADKSLRELNESFAHAVAECRNTEIGLKKTKIYLQSLLERLAKASNLTEELRSAYGVCAQPVATTPGIFSGLFDVPMLKNGIIVIPTTFMTKLKSEDELAFVLAHEFAHFLLKHEVYFDYLQATKQVKGINSPYTAQSEREADELGMRLIVNAGYDLNHALVTTEQLRAKDELHAHAEEMEGMRIAILSELSMRHIRYTPRPSGRYPAPEVMAEITGPEVAKTIL